MKIITDSSRLSDWHSCHRSKFWGYHYNGMGINPSVLNEDLQFGLAFHAGAEDILQGLDFERSFARGSEYIDALDARLTTADGESRRDELRALLYGVLYVYENHFLPIFRSQYEIVGVEKELTRPLSDSITYATRLDVIVKGLQDSMLYNVNYKTSSSPLHLYKENLYNLQLLMEAEAARDNFGWVGGSIIVGVNKGSKQWDKEGTGYRRGSPLVYAYKKASPMGDPEYSPTYRAKWVRVPVWTEPMGVEGWVEYMKAKHLELLKAQVMEHPPLYHPPVMVESVKRQIVGIETQCYLGVEALKGAGDKEAQRQILDAYFPQNFRSCGNYGGFKKLCRFAGICHEGHNPDSPDFSPRIPNHPIESLVYEGNCA